MLWKETWQSLQASPNHNESEQDKRSNVLSVCRFAEEVTALSSGPQLFALSWGWECGKRIPILGEHLAGTGQWHKHETTLNVISGSLGTLRRTQRPFMHVHTGNYIWLCAHRDQQLPFLLCEYFKSYFRKETNSLLSPFEALILINVSNLFSKQTGDYCRRKWEYWSGLLD